MLSILAPGQGTHERSTLCHRPAARTQPADPGVGAACTWAKSTPGRGASTGGDRGQPGGSHVHSVLRSHGLGSSKSPVEGAPASADESRKCRAVRIRGRSRTRDRKALSPVTMMSTAPAKAASRIGWSSGSEIGTLGSPRPAISWSMPSRKASRAANRSGRLRPTTSCSSSMIQSVKTSRCSSRTRARARAASSSGTAAPR